MDNHFRSPSPVELFSGLLDGIGRRGASDRLLGGPGAAVHSTVVGLDGAEGRLFTAGPQSRPVLALITAVGRHTDQCHRQHHLTEVTSGSAPDRGHQQVSTT